MNEIAKNLFIGVASTLSVAAISLGLTLYVDVQILKNNQADQTSLVNDARELLNRIDKTQAIQAEAIKNISEVVKDMKNGR